MTLRLVEEGEKEGEVQKFRLTDAGARVAKALKTKFRIPDAVPTGNLGDLAGQDLLENESDEEDWGDLLDCDVDLEFEFSQPTTASSARDETQAQQALLLESSQQQQQQILSQTENSQTQPQQVSFTTPKRQRSEGWSAYLTPPLKKTRTGSILKEGTGGDDEEDDLLSDDDFDLSESELEEIGSSASASKHQKGFPLTPNSQPRGPSQPSAQPPSCATSTQATGGETQTLPTDEQHGCASQQFDQTLPQDGWDQVPSAEETQPTTMPGRQTSWGADETQPFQNPLLEDDWGDADLLLESDESQPGI